MLIEPIPQRLAISSCERSRSAWPVRDGRDDQFVGAGDPLQRFQLLGDLVGIADELRCGAVLYHRKLFLGQRLDVVGVRVGDGAVAGADRVHPLAVAGGEMPRGGAVVGDHDVGRHHDIRLGQRGRRLERGAVSVDRVQSGGRGDVIARDERQPARTGHLCALALAAAEHPRRQAGAARPARRARRHRRLS